MATVRTRRASEWRSNSEGVDHSRIQRPLSKRGYQPARGTNFLPRPTPVILKQTYPWSKWPELTIKLRGLQDTTTTYDIWRSFQERGNIKLIELYEDRGGKRDTTGKIIFSPVPRQPFWTQLGSYGLYMIKPDRFGNGYNCRIDPEVNRKYEDFLIRSPIRPHISYYPTMKMIPTALHFGLMVDPQSMMHMQTIKAIPGDEFSFVVDLRRHRIVVTFMVEFVDPRSRGDISYVSDSEISKFDRKNKYMFEIPFAQLKTIRRFDLSEHMSSLIISLESPPAFYRRREALADCHSKENLLWTEFDAWYRQTDIFYDPYILQTATVTTLHKDKPVIDIGICPYFTQDSQ
jgi:RNA-dependent RNA polymerase